MDKHADVHGAWTVRQPPTQLPVTHNSPWCQLWPPTPNQGCGVLRLYPTGQASWESNPTPPTMGGEDGLLPTFCGLLCASWALEMKGKE